MACVDMVCIMFSCEVSTLSVTGVSHVERSTRPYNPRDAEKDIHRPSTHRTESLSHLLIGAIVTLALVIGVVTLVAVWWACCRVGHNKVDVAKTDEWTRLLPRKRRKQVFIEMTRNPFYRVSESSADSGVAEGYAPHHHLDDDDKEYPEVEIRIEAVPVEEEEEGAGAEEGIARNDTNLVALSLYDIPLDEYWEVSRDRLKLGDVLGEGCFGMVRAGHLSLTRRTQVTTLVAVKMLKDCATDTELVSLLTELSIMKLISREGHVNIANLIGCCTQDGPVYVLMEHAGNGNLRDFLREVSCDIHASHRPGHMSDDNDLARFVSLNQLMNYVWQVANGMTFIASKRIVHRDLAARNILVCEGGRRLKISDFGLTRRITQDSDYYTKESKGRIPVKWMAPEALQHRKYSTKSDVWSFGVLLWEIFSLGSNPYPQVPVQDLLLQINTGKRMRQPRNCPEQVYDVMLWSWELQSSARPNFAMIRHYAEHLWAKNRADHVQLEQPWPEVEEGRMVTPAPPNLTPLEIANTLNLNSTRIEVEPLHISQPIMCSAGLSPASPDSGLGAAHQFQYPSPPQGRTVAEITRTGDGESLHYAQLQTPGNDAEDEYLGPDPDPRYTVQLPTLPSPADKEEKDTKLDHTNSIVLRAVKNKRLTQISEDTSMLRIHSAPSELRIYMNHPPYLTILPNTKLPRADDR